MPIQRFVSPASRFLTVLGLCAGIGLVCQPAQAKSKKEPPPRLFYFEIDDAMPLHELLPAPPKVSALPGVLNEDLARVPELSFGEPLLKVEDAEEKMAHIMAKINRLNAGATDGFMKTLLSERGDLRGMPFLLGKDCRTEENQAIVFASVVTAIHSALEGSAARQETKGNAEAVVRDIAKEFWNVFRPIIDAKKHFVTPQILDKPGVDLDRALVAALMQTMGPRPEPYRVGLAQYLTTRKHVDATRALANLALYAPEERVRAAAIDGLKTRSPKDYTDVLLQGFRYPLPAVSKRAADALVKLQAKDSARELVKVLEEPDPRAPAKKIIDGKEVSFVRELVRVNHHRNCVLCHAPAARDDAVFSAPVALPDRELPAPSEGYGRQSSPDIFVRIDMTYLRQDFSLMMKVEKKEPWPEMQRFDFFVRTRILTAQEAAEGAKQLAKQTPPNHVAAQFALRELTGHTPAEVTPQGWRRVLKGG